MDTMTEKQVETALRAHCTKRGVICWKFTSPGTRGVPDRLLIGKGGTMGFIEVKRPGKKPTVVQKQLLKRLDERGIWATFCDSLESAKLSVDNFVAYDNYTT